MTIIRHDKLYLRDRMAVLAFRGIIALQRQRRLGPEVRADYDKMIARTSDAAGVRYQHGTVGGVPGWWCHPADTSGRGVMLYLHGGGYVVGSAQAYRHFVGHIATRARLAAFVADYALAPEHPFPAAVDDAMAAYRGLASLGYANIVLAGDSAGGGLGLTVLAKASRDPSLPRPSGAMVLSPMTDFALTGDSIEGRAKADPVIKRKMLEQTAETYLRAHDRRTPDASPLYADLSALPPVQIHVGDNEILLDDSVRYGERFESQGGDVAVHVWRGMPHVFSGFVDILKVAAEALDIAGAFIRQLTQEQFFPGTDCVGANTTGIPTAADDSKHVDWSK